MSKNLFSFEDDNEEIQRKATTPIKRGRISNKDSSTGSKKRNYKSKEDILEDQLDLLDKIFTYTNNYYNHMASLHNEFNELQTKRRMIIE